MQANHLSQEFFGSILTMLKQGTALTETHTRAHHHHHPTPPCILLFTASRKQYGLTDKSLERISGVFICISAINSSCVPLLRKGPSGCSWCGGQGQHSLGTLCSPGCLTFILSICLVSWRQYWQFVLYRAMFCCWGSNMFFKPFSSCGRGVCPSTPEPLELTSIKLSCNEGRSWCSITKTHWGVHTQGTVEVCWAYCCSCCSQWSHPGSGLPLGMVVPPLPVLPCSCLHGCQTRELIWLRMNTDTGRIYARLKLL